jgi:sugar lactone lactonase YvrE
MSPRNSFRHEVFRRKVVCSLFMAAGCLNVASRALKADIVYISDENTNNIYRYDSDGTYLGVFAVGPKGASGMALDSSGNLYVAGSFSNTIEKFSPTGVDLGVFSTVGLNNPIDIKFGPDGNLYASNFFGGGHIEQIAPNGTATPFGNAGTNRHGLAFDSSGNLYASDYGANNITEFAPNGSATSFAASNLHGPTGLAFDTVGNLYVANAGTNNVVEFSPNGTYLGVFASTGLAGPAGMAFDGAGNLYVANGNKVSEYSPAGSYLGAFANVGATWVLITGPIDSIWNGTAGNWSDGSHWSTAPNSPSNGSPANRNYEALINSGIVSLDTSPTITSLKILGGSLTGSGNLTLSNGTVNGHYGISGITTIDGGLLSFAGNSQSAGPITGSGSLQVAAGTFLTSDGVTIGGTWTINGYQALRLGAGNGGISVVPNLPAIGFTTNGFNVTFTGTLDLTDNKLIVQSSSNTDKLDKIIALNSAIQSGAAGGSWTGSGITSSVAAADSAHLGVGIFDNNILQQTAVGGKPVDSNSVFLSFAHLGDANDNGAVDLQDQSIVTNNWQKSAHTWTAGDLNGDGLVDIQDLTIVTNNWQQSTSLGTSGSVESLSVSAVPEPATFFPLATSLVALLFKKRRKPFVISTPV